MRGEPTHAPFCVCTEIRESHFGVAFTKSAFMHVSQCRNVVYNVLAARPPQVARAIYIEMQRIMNSPSLAWPTPYPKSEGEGVSLYQSGTIPQESWGIILRVYYLWNARFVYILSLRLEHAAIPALPS